MRITFGSSNASPANFNQYWIIYILHLVLVFLINSVLSFYFLVRVNLPIKIFTISTFILSPIYLMESLTTRAKYVEFFSEIKSINVTLMPGRQEKSPQVSKDNVLNIVFVLVVVVIQLCVICVKFFIYGTFDLKE